MNTQFGIDKLNFYVPTGEWDITPKNLKKHFTKQTITLADSDKETTRYFNNTGTINLDITKDNDLIIGTNPSHLLEPENYLRPKTFLTDDLKPYIDILDQEIIKGGLNIDNVLNLKPCRLDFATQNFTTYNFGNYQSAFDMLGGKRQTKDIQFGMSSRIFGNASHQIMIYNKSEHLIHQGLKPIEPNFSRCEIRLMNGKEVRNKLASTLEGLANLQPVNFKKFNNQFLDNKLFHRVNQTSIAFEENINLINEIKKKHPRDSVNFFVMSKGINSLIAEFGGVTQVQEFLKEQLKDKSKKTLQRKLKLIDELIFFSYVNEQTSKDNILTMVKELQEIFYLKTA
jgi:hypothetical protein